MTLIHRRLQPVRTRQQRFRVVQFAATGLLIAAGLALCDSIVRLLLGHHASPTVVASLLLVGPVGGLLLSLVRSTTFHQAASAVDAHYGLKDRSTTALEFLEKPDARTVYQLQLQDAEAHLAKVDALAVAPWKTPRTAKWAIATSLAAIALLAITLPAPTVSAALVVNDVVQAQAARAAEQIELLKQQNEEDQDPEIEQLIEKLSAKVEALVEPGVDVKEAMAMLSEMQAALLEQQQKLEESSTEQALQSIGDALSMAGAMSAAGSALAAGNYAKATEELDKIEQIPDMDRQTNRTVTEKLEKARDEMAAAKLQNLKAATENLAEGMASGNGDKFSEGTRGLAGEAKKQGKRKRLGEFLRSQSDALSEAKDESDNRGGSGRGKGGNQWGLGKSGNEQGDKTQAMGAKRDLQLKGQEGDEGDVDSETSHSPERRERAQRGYREKFERSQKLNDSVLDSEPIPLGHRQTIRRYFELIRPQQSEMDQVKEKTESK